MAFAPFTASAPGKIILSGEHSVVYGNHALSTVVERRTFSDFSPSDGDFAQFTIQYKNNTILNKWNIDDMLQYRREILLKYAHDLKMEGSDDELVTLCSDYILNGENDIDALIGYISDSFQSLSLEEHKSCKIDETIPDDIDPDLLSNLNRAPVIVFLTYFLFMTKKHIPISVKITSDLPMGSGLGSSASLCASICAGFYALYNTDDCSSIKSKSFSQDELKSINSWTFQGERIIHGTPSGIDNTCVVYGGLLVFKKVDGKPVYEFLPSGCIPDSTKLIITDTTIPKNTKVLCAGVLQRKTNFPSIMNSLLTSFDSIALEMIKITKSYSDSEKSLVDDHAWYNDASILLKMNQNYLDAIGVGHPVISQIIIESTQFGFTTKLTGAGGGGSVITITPPGSDKLTEFEDVISEKKLGYSLCGSMGGVGVRIEQ